MKRKIIFIALALVILGVLGYLGLSAMFSGPLYNPGDLSSKSAYQHLLKKSKKPDLPGRFVINEKISLHYFTKGQGKPVLVVHGGPGIPYQEAWKGLDSLTSDFQFYYYDQRGCGKSSRPFDKFSGNFYENMMQLHTHLGLPAQIADIEQIRHKIGVEKLTIIGHSFGGFLASLYAIEFPNHVEQLILVSPANVVKMPGDAKGLYDVVAEKLPEEMQTEYQAYLNESLNFKDVFQKSEKELVALNSKFVTYYNQATKAPTEEIPQGVGGWVQNAMFFSMGKKHDYTRDLNYIKAPTLILHGEDDIIPVESVNDYLHNIPNAKLKVIPNSTHFPFNEQPQAFGEIVKSELEGS